MKSIYHVKLKLPLPFGPLQEGIPEPDRRPISFPLLAPREFATAADALGHARKIVQEGYGVSITGPDGREWPHVEILRRLNQEP